MKGQHSPWFAWSVTASLPTGFGTTTNHRYHICKAMARTHVRPRDVMGRRLASFFGYVTGVHPRHPGGLTHPPFTGVFPFIFVINKCAVLFAVASFGLYGARNNNETATRLTTRMSEIPVFITWRRRDLETPHLRLRQCQWVVNTLSRRSSPYECGSLDLQIATPRFANQLSTVVGR